MSTKKQRQAEAEPQKASLNIDSLRWVYLVVCLLLVVAVFMSLQPAMLLLQNTRSEKNVQTQLASYTPWPKEVCAEFQRMLIQNGGRVKPANTFARYALMQIGNGTKVKFKTKDGEKHAIRADEWLMNALFRSDIAKELPIFNVDDTDVVAELGVKPKDGDSALRKRDKYSYNQLAVARGNLSDEGARLAKQKKEYDDSDKDITLELSRKEIQLLRLSRNVSFFEYMLNQFAVVKKGEQMLSESVLSGDLQRMASRLDMTEFLQIMPEMSPQQLVSILRNPAETAEQKLLQTPFRLFAFYAQSGRNLVLFPPQDKNGDEWGALGDGMFDAMMNKSAREWVIQNMQSVSDLYLGQKAMFLGLADLSKDADEEVRAVIVKPMVDQMQSFVDRQKAEVTARYELRSKDFDQQIASNQEPLEDKRLAEQKRELKLEGATAEREVKHYNKGRFHSAVGWYGFGFIAVAVSWFLPGSRFSKGLTILAVVFILLGLYYNSMGILERCLIRRRPPITNLYDTVIFITATTVLLALFLEFFTRKGVGMIVAAVGGMAGIFLSFRHETNEATDTMDPLQAVLDTNFWLATHVVTINIGYAAGLLAMLLGGYYLIHRFIRPLPKVVKSLVGKETSVKGEVFRENKETRDFFKTISTMTYGIICFCLLFSIVGTVLGGVWANYSWGRFWGWDPKENGALMICLWALVILHAKMGGYIRDIGIAMNAVFLGMVVTFSWWGVNNLGVGLHSYGFTEGVWDALKISWIVSIFIMACGIPLWMHERHRKKVKKSKGPNRRGSATHDSDSGMGERGATGRA